MPNRENLEKEVALATDLKSLVTAYEEISVMRIQHNRSNVLAARKFHEGLTKTYTYVRASQYRELKRLQRRKERKQRRHPQTKPEITILLSADRHLSGTLPRAVFRQFLNVTDKKPTSDIAIIGRTGKESFSKVRPDRPFTFFDLAYEHITREQIRSLLTHVLQYENVTFVYGQFINLVKQEPTTVHIASTQNITEETAQQPQQEYNFLFEPSLEEIVTFFEKQIFAMVVTQTSNEAFLAQLGSRITAMESASQQLVKYFERLTLAQNKQRHIKRNRKHRQQLAGLSLWQTW